MTTGAPDHPAPPAPSIRVEVVSYDFGNTLVVVDRARSRAVAATTAEAMVDAGIVADAAAFRVAWAEERDRQFRDEVPQGREVDLAQRTVRVLARLRGMEPPPADGRWDDVAAARLAEPREVDAAIAAYSAAFVATMPPLPGAGAHLRRMAQRGFRLAILSNWPLAATIDRYAEIHGWAPSLVAILVSQRLGAIKPHPEIFRLAAAALATDADRILHVGDDWAADVVGAKRAGWHAAYLRNRQTDTPLPTSTPDAAAAPDLVIDSLGELEARVDRWRP